MRSPADEQEEHDHEIRRIVWRQLSVLNLWWLVFQAAVPFMLCAGAPGSQKVVAAVIGALLACDVLLLIFAILAAVVVLTNWSAISLTQKVAGLAPSAISLLEFR